MEQKEKRRLRRSMFLIVFAILVYSGVQHLGDVWNAVKSVWNVFGTVIAALCIAFVLNAPMNLIEGRVFHFLGDSKKRWVQRLQRPAALVTTLLLTFGLIVLLLLVIIPELESAVEMLMALIPSYYDSAMEWLQGIVDKFGMQDIVLTEMTIDWVSISKNVLKSLFGDTGGIIDTATGVTTAVFGTVISVAFALILAVYIMAQKEKIGRFAHNLLYSFLPEKAANRISDVTTMTGDIFSGFITGQLLECCILGVLCFVGMKIFRFPQALLISVVIGVSQMIPLVGCAIGEAIGALLIFITSPLQALLFLVYILCLQQLEGSLIYPRVMGESLGLPGILVFAAVIVGSKIGGLMGALLSVPITAVLYTLLKKAMAQRALRVAMADAHRERRRQADYAAADATVMTTTEMRSGGGHTSSLPEEDDPN